MGDGTIRMGREGVENMSFRPAQMDPYLDLMEKTVMLDIEPDSQTQFNLGCVLWGQNEYFLSMEITVYTNICEKPWQRLLNPYQVRISLFFLGTQLDDISTHLY